MKKISVFLFASLVLASMCFAGGMSVWTETKQLYSSATGTDADVTSSSAIFQNPVRDLGCDIATSPTTSVVVRIDGKSEHGGFDTSGLTSAVTCTLANCYFAITGKPVSVIRAVISSSTDTTSVVKVNCTGMQ